MRSCTVYICCKNAVRIKQKQMKAHSRSDAPSHSYCNALLSQVSAEINEHRPHRMLKRCWKFGARHRRAVVRSHDSLCKQEITKQTRDQQILTEQLLEQIYNSSNIPVIPCHLIPLVDVMAATWQHRPIFMTHERHKMSESAGKVAANLLMYFLNL